MATQDMKVKLVIQTQTEGAGEVAALAAELEDLASQGSGAAPKFDALAQSLRELAAQDRLIDNFTRLRRETQTAGDAMDAASTQVDGLAAQLQQSGEAATLAAQAQASAARDLDAARAQQAQLRDAIAATRAGLQQEREALAQAGHSRAQYTQETREAAGQLRLLVQEERQARATVTQLADAYRSSAAASRSAAGAQRETAAEYDRAVRGAGQLSGAVRQSNQALQQARDALQAAGIDTRGLSDQQLALKARLLEAQRQAQQYTDVVRDMRGEAQALSPALEAAFRQLGMRGVQQITAEIERLQAAMHSLRGQDILPQDAQRAAAGLQQRIEALRAEMRRTQGAADGAADAVQDLGRSADGAGNQLGAAAHKALAWAGALVGLDQIKSVAAAVIDTGSSFEQLEQRLSSILGSAEKAQTAFAMLKDLAQTTPFEVQGLSEAYAQLAAFGLKPTREQMLAMADAAAELGGGTEMLQGVTLALGQAWVKGKLQGEEMLQLAERGIPAWDLLAKATGKNVTVLQKLAEEGKLGRDAILQLIDAMGQKSAGASADLMNSYAGAVLNAQDALKDFYNMIAESGVLEYLTTQIQGLLEKFDALKDSGELEATAKRVGAGFVDVANAAQAAIGLVQQLAPAFETLLKVLVVAKVSAFAGALTATGSAARSAGTEMAGAAAQSKLFATISTASLALVAIGVIELGKAWLTIAKNYGAYQAELKKHDALNAQVQQKQELVAQKLKAISDATGVVVTSMQELEAVQAKGLLVFDAASDKWLSGAQTQKALANAIEKTNAELARQDAEFLVKNFDESVKAAGNVEEALKKVAAALEFNDFKSVSTFALGLESLAATGKATAQQVGAAWQEALGKLNAGQIGVLRFELKEASRQGILSAEQWAQVNEQILAASFDKLGVNAAQALGQISDGAREAIHSVDLVADSAKAAGVGVQDAARAIEMAFMAAIPKADSLQAIDALEQKLKAMGAAGQISAQGMERSQAALDKQRATIEDQIPGIQSLTEALRQLGVKPQAELKAMAQAAKEAFEVVKASGTATPREIDEAWKAMAEASIAATNGVADASIKAQAAQHGFAIETDKAGKSTVKSMEEAEGATKKVGEAAQAAGDAAVDAFGRIDYAAQMAGKSIEELTTLMRDWDGGASMVDSAAMANAAANELTNQWRQAQVEADAYYQELFKILQAAEGMPKGPRELEKAIWEASAALKELDKQQQAIERSSSDAASGLLELQDRLLELSGSEEEVAAARYARDQSEVQQKMALLKLDIQRAQIRKNGEETARLEKELDTYQQQLQLLEKIYRKEKSQREEKGRAEKEAEKKRQQEDLARQQEDKNRRQEDDARDRAARGGAGGGSASVTAAPALREPTAPINITLNANGINDPVKLARLMEPELKKIAALAR